MALHHDDIRIGKENGFEIDFQTLRRGRVIPCIHNVDRIHFGQHAADNRAGSIRLKVFGPVVKHAEYGRIVFGRAFQQYIDNVIQRFHGDAVPKLRIAGNVTENLKPFQIIRKIVVAHCDDRNIRRFRRRLNGGIAAHRRRADDKVGL